VLAAHLLRDGLAHAPRLLDVLDRIEPPHVARLDGVQAEDGPVDAAAVEGEQLARDGLRESSATVTPPPRRASSG